jgi:hypothetical protein
MAVATASRTVCGPGGPAVPQLERSGRGGCRCSETTAAATSTRSPRARACSGRVGLITLSVGRGAELLGRGGFVCPDAMPLRRSDGSVSEDHLNIVSPRCEPLTELAGCGGHSRWVTPPRNSLAATASLIINTMAQREDVAQWLRSDRPTAPSLGPVWTETLSTAADETEASNQARSRACETMRPRCRSAAADRRRATAGLYEPAPPVTLVRRPADQHRRLGQRWPWGHLIGTAPTPYCLGGRS